MYGGVRGRREQSRLLLDLSSETRPPRRQRRGGLYCFLPDGRLHPIEEVGSIQTKAYFKNNIFLMLV